MNLNIGTIISTECNSTVKHKFHVGCSACFLRCKWNLLGYIAGRNYLLCIAYIVVRYHQHLKIRAYLRIIINYFLKHQYKMYNILSYYISRSSLCTKDTGNRSFRFLACLNFQILVDNIKCIHLLTLVFMKSLNLYIKYWIRIKLHTLHFLYILYKCLFIGFLYFV